MDSERLNIIGDGITPTDGFRTPVKINYLVAVVANLLAFGGSKENINKFGLTVVQLRIIGFIWQMGPQTLSDISQNIHHDRSTLSRSAAALEKQGLIIREPNRRHKKSPFLCLSDKGKSIMEEINPAYRKRAEKLTSVLTNKEQEQLVHLLEKLKDHVEDLKAFDEIG